MRNLNQYVRSHIHHFANPNARHGPWPERLSTVISADSIGAAAREIKSWPGYGPTPLRSLDTLASELDIATLWYKDEAQRFALGSFKALGGAYAVLCLLMRETSMSAAEISTHKARDQVADITVVTATDGNHGRAVAWGAQRFGCRARIYIHAEVSAYREQAMAELGAEVVRVDGNYDESVRQAARDARDNNWFVVSDTSWPGYTEVPAQVMAGYTVMVGELFNQWPDGQLPTHVFVQGGVGGLAAAVIAAMWIHYGSDRPIFIVVEPADADCLLQSATAGDLVKVDITRETIMAGLSCGEVSPIAWSIIELGADHFLSITDDNVTRAMGDLATKHFSDEAIVGGESAVAGLCGLIQVATDKDLAAAIDLNPTSRVLVLGTEGATDPDIYRQATGVDP
ncbi:MAG: PLP-dependent lyase/thiolase [marine bacterium B5-7]|nr:MAG: PLP-dependent lyase/thiolase [marine bacterium B5-7]